MGLRSCGYALMSVVVLLPEDIATATSILALSFAEDS
jgi:hypothetical protein